MNRDIWRHRRIWVEPEHIGAIRIPSSFPASWRQYIHDWVASGRPFVGRAKNTCEVSSDDVSAVGLMLYAPPLPKERLSLLIDSRYISKIDHPLLLADVFDYLPPSLFSRAEKLIGIVAGDPIMVRVYGSAFWSYENKFCHMTDNSDIDLLIQFREFCDLDILAKKLCNFSKEFHFRLDGEFEFYNGESVNWQEFGSDASELLVKSDFGPKLIGRRQIMESFRASMG